MWSRLSSKIKGSSPQEEFWSWFKKNENMLLNFEAERERVFDKLSVQLAKVDPDLTFEFGPPEERREFVISAGGLKRAFPAVIALADAAPKLAAWRFTAFRPRRSADCTIKIGKRSVAPEDVQFTLLDDGEKAGLYLFLPGFRDGDSTLGQIGYLFLDGVLGEFDVEMRLGLIKMLPPEAVTQGDRYPLTELPELFDALVERLEGRSKLQS